MHLLRKIYSLCLWRAVKLQRHPCWLHPFWCCWNYPKLSAFPPVSPLIDPMIFSPHPPPSWTKLAGTNYHRGLRLIMGSARSLTSQPSERLCNKGSLFVRQIRSPLSRHHFRGRGFEKFTSPWTVCSHCFSVCPVSVFVIKAYMTSQ